MLKLFKNKDQIIHYTITNYLGKSLTPENIDEITFAIKKCPADSEVLLKKEHLELNEDGTLDIEFFANDTEHIPARPFGSFVSPYVAYFEIEDMEGNKTTVVDWLYLEPSDASGEPKPFEVEQQPKKYFCERGSTLQFVYETEHPTLQHWIEVRKWWDDDESLIKKDLPDENVILTSQETATFDGRYVYTIYASANPDDEGEPVYVIEKGYLYYKLFI